MWDEQHGRSVTQPRGGRVARRPSSKQSNIHLLRGSEPPAHGRVPRLALRASLPRAVFAIAPLPLDEEEEYVDEMAMARVARDTLEDFARLFMIQLLK